MWISGPRKTFLLIQKFHKDDKDHIAFPSEPRVLALGKGVSWVPELDTGEREPSAGSADLC